MNLDVLWDWIRLANFIILFIAFMLMVYKGAFRLVVDPKGFKWARLLNLCWVIVTLYALGEIMFLGLPGGPRLVLILIISCLQLYVALFRFTIKDVK